MIYSLTNIQITFIVILVLVVVACIAIAISIPLAKKYRKKRFKELCYKKVNSIVLNNDYYLINNYTYRIESGRDAIINHLIFGDKYIYLVTVAYYEGDVTGKLEDQSLIYTPKKGPKQYTDNPLMTNKFLLERLSAIAKIAKELFIGIVVINDDCVATIESSSKCYYIIQKNRLHELISSIESRVIGTINKDDLKNVVDELARSNKRKQNG